MNFRDVSRINKLLERYYRQVVNELEGPGSGRLSRGGWWWSDALGKLDSNTWAMIQRAVVACLVLDTKMNISSWALITCSFGPNKDTDVGGRILDVTACNLNPSHQMGAKWRKPCCHVDPTSLRAQICDEKKSENTTAPTDLVDTLINAILTTKRNETHTALGDLNKLFLDSEL